MPVTVGTGREVYIFFSMRYLRYLANVKEVVKLYAKWEGSMSFFASALDEALELC